MHNAYIGGRSENNIKCVLHDDLGRKNRTACYILPLTGFASDFLSFIVVEHIRFFHWLFNCSAVIVSCVFSWTEY